MGIGKLRIAIYRRRVDFPTPLRPIMMTPVVFEREGRPRAAMKLENRLDSG